MKSSDPYAATDKLDAALLQVIVTRLETRGKHPLFEKMLQDYLDAMQIDTAKAVLDLGCGTGVAARAIARRRGFSGRVLGIDLSPTLAQTAAQLAAAEGLDSRVEFRPGDSRKLDLADGAFDAVVAHTLLSHVDDPLAVVREAARLVRPGGMIGIFDGDYASMTFGHADPAKGKALRRRDHQRRGDQSAGDAADAPFASGGRFAARRVVSLHPCGSGQGGLLGARNRVPFAGWFPNPAP